MSHLVTYQSGDVPGVWATVEPHIQRALDYRGSFYSLGDIYDGLCDAGMQLWTSHKDIVNCPGVIEAALVTTIQIKNDIKFCLFLALGGTNIDEWIKWLPHVEDWAKEKGCEEMRIYGRHGWAAKTNYEIQYTKMTKKLAGV